jgi:hypothetical protein
MAEKAGSSINPLVLSGLSLYERGIGDWKKKTVDLHSPVIVFG